MTLAIRPARVGDIPALQALICQSARVLGANDYSSGQIEAALGSAWGVDTQLIRDGTYFVVPWENQVVACGGWSQRQALFGSDVVTATEPRRLDPLREPARIRAFFVHPEMARRGLGSLLLGHCEAEIRKAGYRATELVATLSGERLYAARGYRVLESISHRLPNGEAIEFRRMRKDFPFYSV